MNGQSVCQVTALGHYKVFDRRRNKRYLVKVGVGMPVRVRFLRRVFLRAEDADVYGRCFAQRYGRLEQARNERFHEELREMLNRGAILYTPEQQAEG